jgi:hypothetical protein
MYTHLHSSPHSSTLIYTRLHTHLHSSTLTHPHSSTLIYTRHLFPHSSTFIYTHLQSSPHPSTLIYTSFLHSCTLIYTHLHSSTLIYTHVPSSPHSSTLVSTLIYIRLHSFFLHSCTLDAHFHLHLHSSTLAIHTRLHGGGGPGVITCVSPSSKAGIHTIIIYNLCILTRVLIRQVPVATWIRSCSRSAIALTRASVENIYVAVIFLDGSRFPLRL